MKKISRILLLAAGMVLVLALMIPTNSTAIAAGGFAGGTGEAGNPWLIETPEHLASIAEAVYYDNHFELIADIDLTGYLSEGGGGWNEGAGWLPIGTQAEPFTGSFDGGGYSIGNLIINRPGTDYIGLFGYIGSGADVRNVDLEDVDATGASSVGGLAGYNNGGAITDCSAEGSVGGFNNIGGLVGYNFQGTIADSYTTVAVTGSLRSRYIGGLVGSNLGTVSGSFATGAVTGGTESHYTGGLVGENGTDSRIEDSYASGAVTALVIGSNITSEVGGLVGKNLGTVNSSYATGAVKGGTAIGGLVGHNDSDILNCYATGSVSGLGGIGGLVGSNRGGGDVAKSYATGSVSGQMNIGGLVWSNVEGGTVADSYYDSQTTGRSDNEGRGEPKTTAQMQTTNTYMGWDFINNWGINPNENDGYPFLRWQTEYTDVRFAGGTGSADDPYKVATAWQLSNIVAHPHEHFVLIDNIDLSEFLLDGRYWKPIGEYDPYDHNKAFTGSFDGSGFTISNLSIERTEPGGVGLFGCTNEATIRNAWLMNVNVIGKDCAGSLVGINNGEVMESYAIGTVAGENRVGGLVGQNSYKGSICGCYTGVNVTGNGNHAGGLVGSNFGGDVAKSYAFGVVEGKTEVGGLVGYSDGDITESYAAGPVSSVTECGITGGLLGKNDGGNVAGSHYDSDITGQSDTGKGQPKIINEMKQQATFVGWDFSEQGTWRSFDNYTYPVFRWQPLTMMEIYAMISIDTAALEIIYTDGDSAERVTRNLTLPEAGTNGTTISWSSSDPSVIADDGTVTMPDVDKTVTMTATVSRDGGTEQTKDFVLTVMVTELSHNAHLSGLALSACTLTPAFSRIITAYSASVGSSVASIGVTPNTEHSNATVTVNGIEVESGSAKSVSLDTGDNTITIAVTAEDLTAVKTYTITVNRASSSSSSGGKRRSTPDYNAKVTGGGAQGTEISIDVNTRLSSVLVNLENQAEDLLGGEETLVITVPPIEGIDTYTLELPGTCLCSSSGGVILTFSTEVGSITIPGNMLTGTGLESPGNLGITIDEGNKSSLPDNVREAIGDRPIIQLTLTVEGENVNWSNPDAPVTVSIPYKPTEEELADPEHITVWYIDGAGNVVEVPSDRYDPATGMVTFSTTHFSIYAVAFVQKTFDDLDSVSWAQKPIEVLASKGILKGISKNEYAPQTNITRADFLYFLVRTLGVDARVDGNFDDISSDAYYHKEIGIAKKLGITNGTGNNKFSPDLSITRQDMMVLTENALRMLKKLEGQGTASDLDRFTDKSLVADYAVNGVASVVREGLIVGSGDKVNPLGNTTRAEAATFLYRIYNKY